MLDTVEVGGALVAFGYMAVRSQWNYLGIASLPGVGAERFLMEVYSIVSGELPAALLFLLAGLIVTAVLRVVLAFLRRSAIVDGKLRQIESFGTRALPFIAIVLLALAQLWLLRIATGADERCRGDVSLGKVDGLVAARCDEKRPAHAFYTIAILCALTAIAVRRMRGDGRTIWGVMTAAVVVIAVQLPLLYGIAVKAAVFPGAQLNLEGAQPPLVGLVVLQTASAVELWTVNDGAGRIVVVPASRITQMTVGRVCDLFEVARTQGAVPSQPLFAACGLDSPPEKIQ
jgi:uncharacterized membrane protein YhaH (DUF805 family)